MTLVVSELSKRFGRVRVLRDVSFDCEAGQVCALVGGNGCGKSTTLSILAGLVAADQGAAELDGQSLIGRRATARGRLGFVPEKANPPGQLNGDQLFGLVAALKGAAPPSSDQIERLGVAGLLKRPIEGLSLGQRRRLCLATALIGDPTLLLLDEPTNGLDADGNAMLIELLVGCQQRGVAIVIATHDRALITATNATEWRFDDGTLELADQA